MGSQCKGITKSGTQCKMTGVFPNGYCRLHQSQYTVEIEQDTEKSDTVAADEKISSKADTTNETISCGGDNQSTDRTESLQKNDKSGCGCFIKLGTIVCTFLFFAALFQLSKKMINKK
ncbi:MAG: hypothetical protein JW915_04735 [Chitinispirillaceae bacterium]|nr:hypothetical protein [Chitinispirillaceae bacterium]